MQLYKFYKISGEEVIQSLMGENASIKFSSAYDLNDPYELKFNLAINTVSRRAKSDFFKSHPDGTSEDFESWKRNASGSTMYTSWTQRSEISQSVTLSSFSMVNDNNLMWSHYAEVHKGICICYDPLLIKALRGVNGFFACGPVKYSTLPPTISNTQSHQVVIKKAMFNKQIEWKYEREYRIVRVSKQETEYLPIPKNLISSVCLGSRTDTEYSKLIVEICKKSNIQIFHASTMGNGYEVGILPHNDKKIYMKTFW
jgi:hypothetical protein